MKTLAYACMLLGGLNLAVAIIVYTYTSNTAMITSIAHSTGSICLAAIIYVAMDDAPTGRA